MTTQILRGYREMEGKYIVQDQGCSDCYAFDTLDEAIAEAEDWESDTVEIFKITECRAWKGVIKWEEG